MTFQMLGRFCWTFVLGTMLFSVAITASARDITVAADGSGECRTVQEAIASLPDHATDRTFIRIKAGHYQGQILIPVTKGPITFTGDGTNSTVLTYDSNQNEANPPSTNRRFPGIGVVVLSDQFEADHLCFENASGDHGQAIALRIDADRAVVRDCRLTGWQDTLRLNKGRCYFCRDYIAGRTDFIYGSAIAVFDHCEIHSRNGGYITAANTPENQPFGFVFVDCTLTGDSIPWNPATTNLASTVKPNATPMAYLGRPWRPFASVAFIRCEMGAHIKPEGWDNWRNPANEQTARYSEYRSTGPGGNADRRVKWSHQLSDEQAAKMTIPAILGGDDHWNPQLGPPPATTMGADFPEPQPPRIPDNRFNITAFGSVGDGKTLNTAAITAAVAACAKAGGGHIVVPVGTFLTGRLTLSSNIDLHLESGAVLLLSDDERAYRNERGINSSCISADQCHDLAITGDGTIDGQGERWWAAFRKIKGTPAANAPTAHRPYLVALNECTRVMVRGVTLTNSPSFHLVPRACTDVAIDHVHFKAPADAPNTDGLDPSGWRYAITDCVFDVGDDCIAIKPSGNPVGGKLSCEDFCIADCTFLHGHGLSIGGQTPGGLRHMLVHHCAFDGTDAGIRMKAGRGFGGTVEDISYDDLVMKHVKVPIYITSYYPKAPQDPAADPAKPVTDTTPIWRDIRISNLTSTDSPEAGRILGLAEMPIQGIAFTNVAIASKVGLTVIHANGITFDRSSIHASDGPPLLGDSASVSGLTNDGSK